MSQSIPLVILGVPFHSVTLDGCVQWCLQHMEGDRAGYIATPNLDFVMKAVEDPELYRILAEADMVIADGMPIVWLSKELGPELPERVAGSDLVYSLAKGAAPSGKKLFTLGGKEGVPEKAGQLLCEQNPGLQLAGAYSPPLADLLEMDHDSILSRLEESKPDMLYVAFGAPKQEKWINMHVHSWKVPLALGIGGSLDFIAGAQTRAPAWMQKSGTEWIWRLGTNPKRLWKRYSSNFFFLMNARKKIRSIRDLPHQAAEKLKLNSADAARIREWSWQAAADFSEAEKQVSDIQRSSADSQALLINLQPCEWLSSLELGVLLSLGRWGKQQQIPVLVGGLSERLRKWIQFNNLDQLLQEIRTQDELQKSILPVSPARAEIDPREGLLELIPPPEITAARLPEWKEQLQPSLDALPKAINRVELNCRELRFLDSAGIGYLVAIRHQLDKRGCSFQLRHVSGAPMATLKISRVDRLLIPKED